MKGILNNPHANCLIALGCDLVHFGPAPPWHIKSLGLEASWRRFRCRREQRNSQRELFDKRLGDLQKAGDQQGKHRHDMPGMLDMSKTSFRLLIQVEGLLPDVQRATFVFNALQKFLCFGSTSASPGEWLCPDVVLHPGCGLSHSFSAAQRT